MKRLLVAGLVMVGVSVMALPPQAFQSQWLAAQEESAPILDLTIGLVHYWNPGETLSANDQVGTLHGTVVGFTNSTAGWDMGTANTKYVTTATLTPSITTYSISVWLKSLTTAMDSHSYRCYAWQVAGAANPSQIEVVYNPSNHKMAFTPYNSIHKANWLSAATLPANDTWQHWTFVCDDVNNKLSIYFNGELDSTNTLTITPITPFQNQTCIGGRRVAPTTANTKYHGTIDQLRFYSYAVDEDMARAIYAQTKASKGL